MSSAKFDDYAANYDALHAKTLGPSGEGTEYFAEYKLACLKRLGAPKSEPLLDYGCGIGNVTAKLASYFEAVYGYDPSAESLDVARERIRGAKFETDLAKIPDNHFTTAVLSGVLHHVQRHERTALLESVRSKLRPGGRLFVFEHNPLNPLTQRLVATCEFDDDADLLWPWGVRRLLEGAAFRRVSLDYIVFFPRWLARLRPLEPHLRWLPVGAQTLTMGTR